MSAAAVLLALGGLSFIGLGLAQPRQPSPPPLTMVSAATGDPTAHPTTVDALVSPAQAPPTLAQRAAPGSAAAGRKAPTTKATAPAPTRPPARLAAKAKGTASTGPAGGPAATSARRFPPLPAAGRPTVRSLAAAVPVSLEIPALRVRTSLVQLGLTSTGTLQVPSGADYDRAGWYKYSPTPGSIGPAVIAGHVDSARRGPSVFFGLAGLRNGDVVRVARSDGTVALFAVDTVRRYAKAQFPTQLVYGNTSNAVLRLITCGGTFDRQRGSYRDNIIVTATLVATG